MTAKAPRLTRLAYPIAVLAVASLTPVSARADFFDDLRRTFQSDIPHFFQDDIPCAFGGRPTSGTKTSCKPAAHAAKPAAEKSTDKSKAAAAPPERALDPAYPAPPPPPPNPGR